MADLESEDRGSSAVIRDASVRSDMGVVFEGECEHDAWESGRGQPYWSLSRGIRLVGLTLVFPCQGSRAL